MSYEEILTQIKHASASNKAAKLIAVSKLQSAAKIRALAMQGQLAFGENYVQEAIEKIETLRDLTIEWHFIGHLQKNKVKQVVGNFAYIHSVDSVELAEKISQQAGKLNLRQKILLEVNIANEASKAGFKPQNLEASFLKIVQLPHLQVCGLMTMPPLLNDNETTRGYFHQLKKLADKVQLPELSMGTSADYQTALKEGATMIRLGTVLFGERPRKT